MASMKSCWSHFWKSPLTLEGFLFPGFSQVNSPGFSLWSFLMCFMKSEYILQCTPLQSAPQLLQLSLIVVPWQIFLTINFSASIVTIVLGKERKKKKKLSPGTYLLWVLFCPQSRGGLSLCTSTKSLRSLFWYLLEYSALVDIKYLNPKLLYSICPGIASEGLSVFPNLSVFKDCLYFYLYMNTLKYHFCLWTIWTSGFLI